MNVLHMVLAAIIVLGPLIAIHEFGHFWVARRCGVKVLTFSIGFGPALFSWRDRMDTEFRIALIPLGGFVRMVDEREGSVAEELLPVAFNRKSVWARMAIVFAGPAINLLFAVFLYWIVFLQGVETLRTEVGRIVPGSPAAVAGLKAGDEIRGIDGRHVETWDQVTHAILKRVGESGVITVTAIPQGQSAERQYSLPVTRFLGGDGTPDPLKTAGFLPYMPPVEPIIGEILPEGAAARQGLKTGDRLLSANGRVISNWHEWVDLIQDSPEQPLMVRIKRGDQVLDLRLVPEAQRNEAGQRIGRIGAGVKPQELKWPDGMWKESSMTMVSALAAATEKTWDTIAFTVSAIGKMLSGLISVDNLSGPITIAKVAGASASYGWVAMLGFMAMLSVSLGVLNLLPIPVLDGGHLLYYSIEAVTGRPLSEKVQMVGLRIGVAIMGSLMLLALFNDISRSL